jgi:glycerophosphoryl diester phosphodiesterase
VNYSELPDDICTLDEALDACVPMWVNVEIKNDPEEPDFDISESIADETVACLARRPEGDNRWLISSFRRETIDRCQELRPSIATAWLTVGVRPEEFNEVLSGLVKSGHSALHPWVNFVTQETIDACHQHGLALNAWTCDDPTRMAELMTWGIVGICTNVPDVAMRVRDQSLSD